MSSVICLQAVSQPQTLLYRQRFGQVQLHDGPSECEIENVQGMYRAWMLSRRPIHTYLGML